MGRGAMIGRGMVRSCGQVAMSVVATLIATQIYTALKHDGRPVQTANRPSLTSGGKFDARLASAATPMAEPARPLISIVDWAITPPHPASPVPDVAWSGIDDAIASPAQPAPKPVHREPRRNVVAVAVAATPPAKPAALPQLDLHTAPASPDPAGLFPIASNTVHALISFGGSAVAFGGTALGRLMP